ncbi:MAG: IS982 family transposase, partial [Propionibacteriaceae bacterium]|nr:IS982 family transposase [Propionibacteriaceae bacterium]
PERVPYRPVVGFQPRISDAEIITLAVMGALRGHTNESQWLRHAKTHLTSYFPYIPNQPGYNKRLRKLAETIDWVRGRLARSTDAWSDGVWLADSTPVETARSRPTVKRTDLAGDAQYGYCASHTRYFYGFRLHLLATLSGLVVGYALTGAKADERATLLSILSGLERRPGQTLIADMGYHGRGFEQALASEDIVLIRKARKRERPRPGARFLKPLRQVIESVNATLKTQLDIERLRAKTIRGLISRVATQLLALTAAVWHNERSGAPVLRSLTAYDH